jgi:hypothetical protein
MRLVLGLRNQTHRHDGSLPSRRALLRLIAGYSAACFLPAKAAETADGPLEVDRLWESGSPEKINARTFRVDATILLLSVPVFRCNGVGSARVALRQLGGAETQKMALEFAAASDPARAHGLDRLGWIREVVAFKDGAASRAGVLGIMTASQEQTPEEARAALRSDSGAENLVAIDSVHSAAGEPRARTRVMRFEAPHGDWTQGEGLADLARRSFRSCGATWKEAQWQGREAPSPFLYALKRAMEPGGPTLTEYVWNLNRYTLKARREPVANSRREFAVDADLIHCEVENVTQGLRPLRFQIWIERNAAVPMPLRIEFQPRPFLRLTLEAANSIQPSEGANQ